MRFIVFFTVAFFCVLPAAFCADGAGFDSFIKSREIVATLYFQANSEDLLKGERERIAEAISQLRELQNDGRMIRVEGFSSSEGDEEVNFQLSFFRARAVADIIEAKGMPSEVALTGYGDLRATSDNPVKERRVEIASYIKPPPMKRIKIAKKAQNPSSSDRPGVTQVTSPETQEIDSYSIEQAIKRKIDNRNRGIAEKMKAIDREVFPGLSQSDINIDTQEDLDRGYSEWRRSVDPLYAPKLTQLSNQGEQDLKRGYSQSVRAADRDLKRGYSQSVRAVDNDLKRGYSQSEKAADRELQRGYSQSDKAADGELQRGYSQSDKAADGELQRGYSQSDKAADSDLQRGYSQSDKAADSDLQRGYSQSDKAADDDLKRGYSQLQESAEVEMAPGVTRITPVSYLDIDALMIEQAIMEKIGADLPEPSGTVSQVSLGY